MSTATATTPERAPTRGPAARWRSRLGAEAAILVGVCVVTLAVGNVSPYWTRLIELVLIYALVSQALDLVSGYGGLFSLGHSGLFAIGGYASAILYFDHGVPVILSFAAAVVVAGVAGVLLGGPSLLIGGLYLALVTLSFAFIVQNVLVDWQDLTNGPTGIGPLQPSFSDRSIDQLIGDSYLLWIGLVMAVSWILMRRIVGSRWKRALIAIRESAPLAQIVGVRLHRTKIEAFTVSAGFAGLAGALYAHMGYISPHDLNFQLSVSFLAIIFLGGIGTLHGAVVGAAILIVVPELIDASPDMTLVLYGLVLVLVMVLAPGGLVSAGAAIVHRLVPARRRSPVTVTVPPAPTAGLPRPGVRVGDTTTPLVADDVDKSYAGLQALQGASISVHPGRLTGLIGPNGSGKTTLLNCIGGQVPTSAGTIAYGDDVLPDGDAAARSRHGISRTFQQGALCPSLTCRENVMLGGHTRGRVGFVRAMFSLRKRFAEEDALRASADAMLDYLGVASEYRDRVPGELPYGVGRLVELGVVLMGDPRLILLDEPAAGLVDEEVARLEVVLRDLLDAGIGILLVEHHVQLVLNLAELVVVLDGGRTIAVGPPRDVVGDAAVQVAYLGSEWAQEAEA